MLLECAVEAKEIGALQRSDTAFTSLAGRRRRRQHEYGGLRGFFRMRALPVATVSRASRTGILIPHSTSTSTSTSTRTSTQSAQHSGNTAWSIRHSMSTPPIRAPLCLTPGQSRSLSRSPRRDLLPPTAPAGTSVARQTSSMGLGS
jgi:hypothetical protein